MEGCSLFAAQSIYDVAMTLYTVEAEGKRRGGGWEVEGRVYVAITGTIIICHCGMLKCWIISELWLADGNKSMNLYRGMGTRCHVAAFE